MKKKPYTHVRLILHEDGAGLMDRYEVRTSTFIEFDEDPSRRAISGHPTKTEALEIAKEIARQERERSKDR